MLNSKGSRPSLCGSRMLISRFGVLGGELYYRPGEDVGMITGLWAPDEEFAEFVFKGSHIICEYLKPQTLPGG